MPRWVVRLPGDRVPLTPSELRKALIRDVTIHAICLTVVLWYAANSQGGGRVILIVASVAVATNGVFRGVLLWAAVRRPDVLDR